MLLVVVAVFGLAGAVKGAVGLGLPPIAIGLLAVVMAPVEAAALIVIPSFLTNVWQMLAGANLSRLVVRLWPMLACAVLATLAGTGWMSDANARIGTILLGSVLALYALSGLVKLHVTVAAPRQHWLGPLIGTTTGMATAATGVFSIPVVPYLQAIGLEKDELIQAMGLCFTVSTVALALNLTFMGALSPAIGIDVAFAVAAVVGGMWLGQRLRQSLDPSTFRFWFFLALFGLGSFLVARSVL